MKSNAEELYTQSGAHQTSTHVHAHVDTEQHIISWTAMKTDPDD